MSRPSRLRTAIAAACAIPALMIATPVAAQETATKDVGMGIAAGLCTLVYTPLKLVYATGGAVVSGLVYLWSVGDGEITKRVLRVTAGGDYVVTPEHLRGLRVFRVAGS